MEIVKSPAEQRVVLHNVSWETYERLLAEHADYSAPRFAYGFIEESKTLERRAWMRKVREWAREQSG